jgi:tetratricopeptide (TPR) repeat protein
MIVRRLGLAFVLFAAIACSYVLVKPEAAGDNRMDEAAELVERGEYAKAVAAYEEVIRLNPDDEDGYDSLARLLATCPEDSIRDGQRAVELATKACELSGWKVAEILSTLAAAHAECGHFDEAVKWQKKALKIGFGDEDDTDAARSQLKLYQAGKPYREK